MTPLTFPEALDYLYSFVDYSLQRSYRYSAEVFDLDRVRDLLARLRHPPAPAGRPSSWSRPSHSRTLPARAWTWLWWKSAWAADWMRRT